MELQKTTLELEIKNIKREHLAGFLSLIDQQQFPRTVHRQFRTTVLKTPLEEQLL